MHTHRDSRIALLSRRAERGSMLLELLISMVVLTIGLGGLLVLLVSSMYTNNTASKDTSSTMVAEHILEQISSEPANSNATLTINDCAGTAWTIDTTGASKGSGNSGPNGGDGALLTSAGIIDWTQGYSSIPANYAMKYVACGSGGKQTTYDIRWNVVAMSTFSRMVVISARPGGTPVVGGLRYIVPPNLRTIEGM